MHSDPLHKPQPITPDNFVDVKGVEFRLGDMYLVWHDKTEDVDNPLLCSVLSAGTLYVTSDWFYEAPDYVGLAGERITHVCRVPNTLELHRALIGND